MRGSFLKGPVLTGLLRDKDFLLVCGCVAVGLLQVRAQRKLLKALQRDQAVRSAKAAQTAAAERRTRVPGRPEPMRYLAQEAQAVRIGRALGAPFGLN